MQGPGRDAPRPAGPRTGTARVAGTAQEVPPQETPDREVLPVVLETKPSDDPLWSAFLDLRHLQAEGLVGRHVLADLQSMTAEEFDRAFSLLDELGMRGTYERFVRDTGPVRRCPTWCCATPQAHPPVAIYEPEGTGPTHRAATWRVSTSGPDVELSVSAVGDEDPTVLLADVDLTGDQARALASALARAADVLDGITR